MTPQEEAQIGDLIGKDLKPIVAAIQLKAASLQAIINRPVPYDKLAGLVHMLTEIHNDNWSLIERAAVLAITKDILAKHPTALGG